MTSPTTPGLQELLAQIDQAFVQAERINQTNDEVASAILDWIIKRERVRYQVTTDAMAAQKVDQLTLRKMREWDSNDPIMSTIEKVLRRLAKGDGVDAIILLRRSIKAKADEKMQMLSCEQKRRAQTPRVAHPLDSLIAQFLRTGPDLSEKQLLRKLEACIGGAVIIDMDDTEITLCDDRYKPVKISGLKNRLSKIRGNISQ